MAVTVTPVRILGLDMRCYDVAFENGDTTTEAETHGLPFTPTFSTLIELNASDAFAGFALAVTATTWTLTSAGVQGDATVRVFIGRMTNPQSHR